MARQGFTLIELLVVIAIMGAVLALVGPLGTEQLKRSERIAELKHIENLLAEHSQRAFFQGRASSLTFQGQQLTIAPSGQQINFESLFFPPQILLLNSTGAYSATALKVQSGKRLIELKLPDLADGTTTQ